MKAKQFLLASLLLVALVIIVLVGWRLISGDTTFGGSLLSWLPGTEHDYRAESRSQSWTFELPTTGRLVIESTNLDIRVITSPEVTKSTPGRNIAIVDAWLMGQSTDPDRFVIEATFTPGISTLHISAHLGSNWDPNQPGGGKVVVAIPARFATRITTIRGSVVVEGLNGAKAMNVNGGDIALIGGEGPARLACRGGNISLERYRGDATLEALQGMVITRLGVGSVRARAGISVRLHDHTGGFAISTDRAAVSVDLLSLDTASSISTVSGNITLALAPSAAIRLHATTELGEIFDRLSPASPLLPPAQQSLNDTTVLPTDAPSGHHTSDRSIERDYNGGGASVEIQSMSGEIRIVRSRWVEPLPRQARGRIR